MFTGSIHNEVRKFLIDEIGAFTERKVIVGCSGNFTFEALLCKHGHPAEVHSNDVALYSCALGEWLTGGTVGVSWVPDWSWLDPYSTTNEDLAATVVALSGLAQHLVGNPNAYKERVVRGYAEQFPRIHADTKEKMLKVAEGIKLTSFFSGDVTDHVKRWEFDPQAVFVMFAPTYSGGYERMWKGLESISIWQPPKYETLDTQRRNDLLEWVMDRDFVWIDDRELGFSPVFAVRSGRLRTQYVYSNVCGHPGHVTRKTKVHDPGLPILSDEDLSAKSKVVLLPVGQDVAAFYRENYLNKGIVPASGAWAFLVLLDDKVAGLVNYTDEQFNRGGDDVYLLCDLAVYPTKYKRLSKLIVGLSLCEEVRSYIERARQAHTRLMSTTAFTDASVSMKYRGTLELYKRGENPQGEKFLQYTGVFAGERAKEIYLRWFNRYARALTP